MAFVDSFQMAIKSIFDQFSTVKPTLPPASFFKLPPSSLPRTLPPPSDHPTLSHPFTISHEIYNLFLQPQIPVTIALLYVTLATYLNAVNARRKLKPWAFSQTAFFKIMVITHNAVLAIYSLWTCIGMVNAVSRSFYPPWEEYGFAGTIDSLCKVNGPRGYGSGATYNETTSVWGIANQAFHLGADGLAPDSTDVGRIWNEGLAFYGWLFYLSKFYEVIDTFIILAKGRKSSFLQTYHHAGAMLCMWAGIRYMSPPIWMFVLVNSFIHTIMYTFYFCISLHFKVPVWFKKTLTTMQITQFVVGATYAFLHLFVKYRSPVSVPYLYRLGSVVSAAPSAASSVIATAVASVDGAALFKKLLLRAAGREGLAENVLSNKRGQAASFDAVHAVRDFAGREELRYKQDAIWAHCLDTSGQAFAIWLNCLYLAPLTWLFARFFIKAYQKREERRRSSSTSQQALASGRDAYKGVTRRVSEAFEDIQHGVEDDSDEVAVVDGAEIKKELKKVASATKKGMNNALDELKEKTDPLKAKAEAELQNIVEKTKAVMESTKASVTGSSNDGVGQTDRERSRATIIQETREAFEEAARVLTQKARETTSSVVETTTSVVESISQSTLSSKEGSGISNEGKHIKSEDGTEKVEIPKSTSTKQEETTEQRVPQLQSKESSHRSTKSQDFEDQQSSWIHVKEEVEEAAGDVVSSVQSKAESLIPADDNASKSTEDEQTSNANFKETSAENQRNAASGSEQQSKVSDPVSKPAKTSGEDASEVKDEAKTQQKIEKGDSGSNEVKAHQSDNKSLSEEDEKPTYAEVVAEPTKPDEANQGESQSSENAHESAAQTKASSINGGKSEESTTETTSQTTNQATGLIKNVKDTAENVAEEVKAEADTLVPKIESSIKSDEQTNEPASGSQSQDESLWFEKLTTGIDSKTSTGPSKKEVDKIIDESEVVRDDVVDTAKSQELSQDTSSDDKHDDNDESSSGKKDKDESEDGA